MFFNFFILPHPFRLFPKVPDFPQISFFESEISPFWHVYGYIASIPQNTTAASHFLCITFDLFFDLFKGTNLFKMCFVQWIELNKNKNFKFVISDQSYKFHVKPTQHFKMNYLLSSFCFDFLYMVDKAH